jgi:hypothetical protein
MMRFHDAVHGARHRRAVALFSIDARRRRADVAPGCTSFASSDDGFQLLSAAVA